ncbi:MAG: PIN domain-containing protein [Anaerolineales bacterium]
MPSFTFLKAGAKSRIWWSVLLKFTFRPFRKSSCFPLIVLGESEIDSIKAFLSLCHQVELTPAIIEQTIRIRRQYHFKIPDAVIAASAIALEMPLVSADTHFKKIAELSLVSDILD